MCIAEKPSVAKEIANILGATTRRNGYLEGNGILCYLDIRTLMYPARTGSIYVKMQKMEFRGIADDPLEIQDPSDRR